MTGLVLDPYFAAPKMTWLRENVTTDGVVTTSDTWLLHQLGAGFVTDAATASRTLLTELDDVAWNARALRGVRPGPRGAARDVPTAPRSSARPRPSATQLPVAGLTVDQQAALLGRGAACQPATPSARTGPARSCSPCTGTYAARSTAGLTTSVAWRLARRRPTYCLDGQVYTAGLRGPLAGRARPDQRAPTNWTRRPAPCRRGGVLFVPALAGLGAPHWAPGRARRVHRPAACHRAGATWPAPSLEGIAASVALLAGAVAADLGGPLTSLRVDGGLTRSRLLMQAQADLLQLPVEVYRHARTRPRSAWPRWPGSAWATRPAWPRPWGRPTGSGRAADDHPRRRRNGWPRSRPQRPAGARPVCGHRAVTLAGVADV